MAAGGRKILVVKGPDQVGDPIEGMLGADYACEVALPSDAYRAVQRHEPGVVLCDAGVSDAELGELIRRIKGDPQPPQIVVVVNSAATQIPAAAIGTDDLITTPVRKLDLSARLDVHFRLVEVLRDQQSLREQLAEHDSTIKELASAQMQEVIEMQDLAVFTLANVAESRDNDTGQHLLRMREYSVLLAERLSKSGAYRDQIDEKFIGDLYRSSPLHDIGKVGICDAILLKPGRLTPEEFEVMQRHTVIGAHILDRAVTHSGSGGFLAMAAIIARFHHERWDGKGYPAGLVGTEIPLPARIVSVADVYDALTSTRPYKEAFSSEKAKEIIESGAGCHFDPEVVKAFLTCLPDFCATREAHLDTPATTIGAISFLEYDFDTEDLGQAEAAFAAS